MSSRMVRELADVSDELRAVPAPPLPVLPEPYSMRFADPDADAAMISDYMNQPHLANTWEYAYPADQWRRHLEIQFEGTYSRPYLYSLHFKASISGGTVVRPVFFEFPNDPVTVTLSHQFMWGEALMIILSVTMPINLPSLITGRWRRRSRFISSIASMMGISGGMVITGCVILFPTNITSPLKEKYGERYPHVKSKIPPQEQRSMR